MACRAERGCAWGAGGERRVGAGIQQAEALAWRKGRGSGPRPAQRQEQTKAGLARHAAEGGAARPACPHPQCLRQHGTGQRVASSELPPAPGTDTAKAGRPAGCWWGRGALPALAADSSAVPGSPEVRRVHRAGRGFAGGAARAVQGRPWRALCRPAAGLATSPALASATRASPPRPPRLQIAGNPTGGNLGVTSSASATSPAPEGVAGVSTEEDFPGTALVAGRGPRRAPSPCARCLPPQVPRGRG